MYIPYSTSILLYFACVHTKQSLKFQIAPYMPVFVCIFKKNFDFFLFIFYQFAEFRGRRRPGRFLSISTSTLKTL